MAEKKKRGITFPHMFTLILLIIAVCTILTYIVPAGQYDTYVDDNDVEVFVDGSYHRVEQTPVTPMKALMSVQEGIIETPTSQPSSSLSAAPSVWWRRPRPSRPASGDHQKDLQTAGAAHPHHDLCGGLRRRLFRHV